MCLLSQGTRSFCHYGFSDYVDIMLFNTGGICSINEVRARRAVPLVGESVSAVSVTVSQSAFSSFTVTHPPFHRRIIQHVSSQKLCSKAQTSSSNSSPSTDWQHINRSYLLISFSVIFAPESSSDTAAECLFLIQVQLQSVQGCRSPPTIPFHAAML